MAKRTVEQRPIPSAEVRERIMAKSLLKGYRQWVRDGRPGKNAAK